MVLQHSMVEKSLLWHMALNKIAMCQSRNFPTELCCNTIIHLLFHYFYCIDPYIIFKLTVFFFNTCLFNFFVVAQLASYSVTCHCFVRICSEAVRLKSSFGNSFKILYPATCNIFNAVFIKN